MDNVAAVFVFDILEEVIHTVRKALAKAGVHIAALQILCHNAGAIVRSGSRCGCRVPGVVVVDALDLAVFQVDVLVAELVKAVAVAADGILEGHIHVVPVAIQLYQIPGVKVVIDVAGVQAAGLGRLQESVRVARALGLAVHDAAVGRSVLPAVSFLVLAVFYQPLDNNDFLLKIAHIIGDVGVLEFLDGIFNLIPLILAHHAVVSGGEVVSAVLHGAIGIVIPLAVRIGVGAAAVGTAAGSCTGPCSRAPVKNRNRYGGGNTLSSFVVRGSRGVYPCAACVYPAAVRRCGSSRHSAAPGRIQVVALSVNPLPAGEHPASGTADARIQEIPGAVVENPASAHCPGLGIQVVPAAAVRHVLVPSGSHDAIFMDPVILAAIYNPAPGNGLSVVRQILPAACGCLPGTAEGGGSHHRG